MAARTARSLPSAGLRWYYSLGLCTKGKFASIGSHDRAHHLCSESLGAVLLIAVCLLVLHIDLGGRSPRADTKPRQGQEGEGGGVVRAGVATIWNGAGQISARVLTHTMLAMSARAV